MFLTQGLYQYDIINLWQTFPTIKEVCRGKIRKRQPMRQRLLTLLCQQAYFRQLVTLSSGKQSNYYIDCRKVTLSAEGAYLTAKLILSALAGMGVQAVGGLTLGADPIAAAVAALSFVEGQPLQGFLIRKEAKKHGRRRSIEGPELPPGTQVAIVDDVATTGGSLITAIERVRQETDWQIARVLCLVDRQEGAQAQVRQAGHELLALFTAQELADYWEKLSSGVRV